MTRPSSPPAALTGYLVRVRGPRLERLLSALDARGVHPRDVRREGRRTASMLLSVRGARALGALCPDMGIEVLARRPLGLTRALIRLRRRAALPICALACALALGLMASRIWLVRVDAPAALIQPLKQALFDMGVRPGAARSSLDLRAIEDALTAGVQDVKFCQARVRGVTLTLSAQQAELAPGTLSLNPPGSLYARCDAVIERVQVLSGSAAVKRGDTVRAGDLLIAGLEQSSVDESAPVRAAGIVTGRIWYEGLGECALEQTALERTGRMSTGRSIRLFNLNWAISAARDFGAYDRELTWQPIGGMFLPIGVLTERRYELSPRTTTRSLDDARALALDSARQNALKKCPDNATVIDKFAEYSIIEGNTIQARYVIEVEETIQCSG